MNGMDVRKVKVTTLMQGPAEAGIDGTDAVQRFVAEIEICCMRERVRS